MEKCVILLCLLQFCSAVIYKLNDSDYERMPPLNAVDSFEDCHQDPDAVYCYAEFELVSDTPSPLLEMIKEYSAHRTTHFNHTKLRRGICLKETCKKFYDTPELDLRATLEACFNESTYNQYKLKTILKDRYVCNETPKDMQKDTSDVIVGIICGVIVVATLIGSLYDFCKYRKEEGNKLLLCFSIRQNWRKLTAPVAVGLDPRLERLKCLHSIRVITMVLVIMAHSILYCIGHVDNTKDVEEAYHNKLMQFLFSGVLIMQTFLVMSGFLLVYNLLIYAEKNKITWSLLPKFIALRWLRLTPPYAVVLALTATLLRYVAGGPLWKEVVANEAEDCRHYWWLNMLYLNNYSDFSQCMVQCWYLATDTQLYCLGLVVYLACRTPRSRKIVLSVLLAIGITLPALHTYFQDLDGPLIVSPETIVSFFMHEPTFNNTYKRGHTNLAGYVIGLALGYVFYHLQNMNIDTKRVKKYSIAYLLIPLGFYIVYMGHTFYEDRPRSSMVVRMAFASLIKPMFGLTIACAIPAIIFKVDDIITGFMEWRRWTPLSRLTYSAYLLHIAILRNAFAMRTTPTHFSIPMMFITVSNFVLASFIAALPFWLMVEAPLGNLIRIMMAREAVSEKVAKINAEITNGHCKKKTK